VLVRAVWLRACGLAEVGCVRAAWPRLAVCVRLGRGWLRVGSAEGCVFIAPPDVQIVLGLRQHGSGAQGGYCQGAASRMFGRA
jgi:hypothetical protein